MTMTTYTLVVYSRVNITDDFLLPEANEADNTAQVSVWCVCVERGVGVWRGGGVWGCVCGEREGCGGVQA